MHNVKLPDWIHEPHRTIVSGHQVETKMTQLVDFAHLFLGCVFIQLAGIKIVIVGILPLECLDWLKLLMAVVGFVYLLA